MLFFQGLLLMVPNFKRSTYAAQPSLALVSVTPSSILLICEGPRYGKQTYLKRP